MVNWLKSIRLYQYVIFIISIGVVLFLISMLTFPNESVWYFFSSNMSFGLILIGAIEWIIFYMLRSHGNYSMVSRVKDINENYFGNIGYAALIISVVFLSAT